ncbi:MAG: PorT family protein [Bacteroides sp.]|nr:PorT family protein [Bacteroides sp.]
MKGFKLAAGRVALVVSMMLASAAGVSAADFVDFSKSDKLIEVDVHAFGGAGSVTQNYKKLFPQIRNLNVNMGGSGGLGFRAVFGLRNYLGFGTSLDVTMNTYNMDMTVMGSDNASMSALFIDNRAYYVNIPVFVSFRFNVAENVRWSVDGGFYYAYGFAGSQKQRIYRADTNAMGELVAQTQSVKTGYFHSPSTFINAFNRGDLGLHLATYVNFGPHLVVGAKYQYGVKNISRPLGVENPSIHNHYLHGVVGYRF